MEQKLTAPQELPAGMAASGTQAATICCRELLGTGTTPPGGGDHLQLQVGPLGTAILQHHGGGAAQSLRIHTRQTAHLQMDGSDALGALAGGLLEHPLRQGHHQAEFMNGSRAATTSGAIGPGAQERLLTIGQGWEGELAPGGGGRLAERLRGGQHG